MKNLMEWKWKRIFLLVFVVICGVMGVMLAGNAATNTETEAEKVSTMHMLDGASVRYQDGYSARKIGLRYSMRIEKREYEELLQEIGTGKTYSSVSFGFLIAPEEYITAYGELTEANVFGKNAIYCYDGAVKGKTEIVNMNTGNLAITGDTLRDVTENGIAYKETNGSIVNLKEENLTKEYRGVGYAKFVTLLGKTSYVFCDDGAENVRSMAYVAQRTIADTNVAPEVRNLLEATYVNPVQNTETNCVINTYLVDENGKSQLYCENILAAKVGTDINTVINEIETSSAIDGLEFHSMEIVDDTAVVYANNRTVINVYYADSDWSGYSILVKDANSDYEELVAGETSKYMEKATGKRFPVVFTSEKETFNISNRYIVIGDNKFTNANIAGQRKLLIPTQDSVGEDGFQVTTIGKSVFIAGATELGTAYGVYDYLNKVIGLDFFDANDAYVDSNVTFAVGEYNYTEEADFKNRIAAGGMFRSDEALRLHFRTKTHQDVYSDSPYHNTFLYLNKSSYESEHPSWYATTGAQLCYTAHGNSEEYNAMLTTVYEKMLAELEADKNLVNLAFTQEDTVLGTWCICSTCSEYKTTYGSDAGGVVKFMNDLSDKLAQAGYGANGSAKRNITLSFFAYNDTEQAPSSITCNANVVPMIAPYYTYRNVALNTNGKNTWEKTNIDNWAEVADTLSFWWYSSNYYNAFYPYYTVEAMASDYKYLYELNNGSNISILNESVNNIEGYATGFNKLYSYVSAKLMWDTSLDVDALVNDYFRKYFGVAATEMKRYYDSYVSTIQAAVNDTKSYAITNQSGYEVPRGTTGNTGYWYGYCDRYNWINKDSSQYKSWFTEDTLNSWSASIDGALSVIANLETTDIQLYNTLKERIYTEKVLVDYWKLVLYGSNDVNTFGQKAEQLQTDMLTGNVVLSRYRNNLTESTRFILDSDARVISYKLSKLSRFTESNISAMDGQEIAYARKIYDANSDGVSDTYLSYLTEAEALYREKYAVVSDTTDLSSYDTTNSYGWQGTLSIQKDDTYGWYLNAYYNGGSNVLTNEEQAVISFDSPYQLDTTLENCTKVKFYVYNGGSDDAQMILTFDNQAAETGYGSLKSGEWSEVEITIDKAKHLTGFGIYNAKYRNGGKPCDFKFSMMYGE